jgi:hypothetical protein
MQNNEHLQDRRSFLERLQEALILQTLLWQESELPLVKKTMSSSARPPLTETHPEVGEKATGLHGAPLVRSRDFRGNRRALWENPLNDF